MNRQTTIPIGFLTLLIACLTLGCRTIPPADTAAFSTGITSAKQQTDLAFAAVNELAEDSILEFAASQPTLNEKNFFVVLEPTSVAAWDRTFGALEKYSQDLVILTSPNLTESYRKSALSLAQEIRDTGDKLKETHLLTTAPSITPAISTAFTKIGDVLIRAKAQADARKVLRETDPHVREVFVRMADAVGESNEKNIRGTVKAHWVQLKGQKQVEFLSAAGPDAKRKLAVEFSELMQKQQAQDMTLASLRRSLLALADAHHALAEGRDWSVSSAVAQIKEEINDTKELYKQFKSIGKKEKQP